MAYARRVSIREEGCKRIHYKNNLKLNDRVLFYTNPTNLLFMIPATLYTFELLKESYYDIDNFQNNVYPIW